MESKRNYSNALLDVLQITFNRTSMESKHIKAAADGQGGNVATAVGRGINKAVTDF